MNHKSKRKLIIIILLIIVVAIAIGVFIFFNNQKYKYELVQISNSEIQYYKLEKDGKYGVIDKNGNVVIEPTYMSIDIPNPTKPIFIKSDDGQKYSAIDNNKNTLFDQYESVEAISINSVSSNIPYEKTVLKYKQNGLYGLMNFEGNKITENIYNSITNIDYKEGNLKIEQNGQFGVINIKGTTIIKPEYDAIIADGYYDDETKYENAGFVLRIKTDDGYRFGYANKNGKIILDTLYNEINRITELEGKDVYLIVSNNGRYGLIKNGKEVLKSEYTEIEYDINNSLLIVQKDNAQGVVDLKGNNIVPLDYDSIIIGGKYINAQKGQDIVIFDAEGNNVNTNIVSYNKVNDNYSIVIDEENNYNIIDNSGNKKLKENYAYIEYLNNNYFIVTKDSKTGVIDSEGHVLVDLKYNAIQKIDGTDVLQATDSSQNRTDIIDSNMKIHEGITNAYIAKKDNYIKLYSENDVKYYTLSGNETTYKDLFPNNSLYASKKDGKWGLVDKNGNVVVNYEYDLVTEQNGNVAGVKKDGKWQTVNEKGEFISENKYTISWYDVTFLGDYYQINSSNNGVVYSGTIQK